MESLTLITLAMSLFLGINLILVHKETRKDESDEAKKKRRKAYFLIVFFSLFYLAYAFYQELPSWSYTFPLLMLVSSFQALEKNKVTEGNK